MNRPHLLALLVALAAAPLALAHQDGTAGYPKPYCEDVAGDAGTHDYGPGGPLLTYSVDGSIPPCPHFSWDRHYEYALGGARFLVTEEAIPCWGTDPDHPAYPLVTVKDLALPSGVAFTAWSDREPTDPVPMPVTNPPHCGDFEVDFVQRCVDACRITIPPSYDGSYEIFIEGTAGHAWAD